MIEVKGLLKTYGSKRAVDGITFAVKRGDILGFLGPNGAGKSTTMKMIAGFLRPDAGTATVEGIDVAARPVEVKRKLGYLPESAPAYPEMSVEEFLGFIAEIRGFRGHAERQARVDRAVALTHLEPVRRQTIETLSKGYKQRVGFAQALLHDPPCLVLDEPTDGLDPNQKNEVRVLIKKMAAEKAVILSTHILEEVEAICNRVIIISRGKVVADEPPERLLARQPGARMDEIFRSLTQSDTYSTPMTQVKPIFKREFVGYFRTPVAYVFIVAFLLISVALAFSRFGGFFTAGIASMEVYLMFLPWLFLFLVPAVGMRLWAEERRSGTAELLFTLPVTTLEAVTGKFLAAWAFLTLAILGSFPMVLTIAYLGSPDWGVVATGYLGAILMAGGFLGVCSLTSALTKNQVISFVVSLLVCAVLVFLGYSGFTNFLEQFVPVTISDAISNFSFITHFNPLTKGIVDPKDVVFFLSLIGFTLFVNVIVLERAGNKLVSSVLLLIGLILVNYLAAALPVRLDATAEHIYTLSPGTKSLLADIKEPITIDLYYSKDAAGQFVEYKNYAERVREMLRQYVRAAHGEITLNVIDPAPDTPEEEKATAAGIEPQTLPGGGQFYFGLVATEADQQKTIPTLTPQREQFLEYDISEAIYSVQLPDKKKLGLITSLPLLGSEGNPMMGQQGSPGQFVTSEWDETYTTVPIEASATELPPNLDALAIVHPENLSPKLLFAIDQFLLSGKPIFIAVDPSSEYFKRQGGQQGMFSGPPPNVSSDLPTLFNGWGIVYDPTKVVGDLENAEQVQLQNGSVVRYPVWVDVTQDDFNAKALPTAQLTSALFVEPGSVSLRAGSSLTFTPLIQTSAQSGTVAADSLQFAQPDEVAKQITPSGRKTIAALITGRFKTAFPDGPPKDEAPADKKNAAPEKPASWLKESKNQSVLIIVADTDWLFDDYSVRKMNFMGQTAAEPINDNLAFAANCLDFLAGSQDLISIRGKGNSLRPFTVVRKMEAAAADKYREKLTALEAELNDVESKLTELQGKKNEGNRLVASPEVAKAIEDFQRKEATLRGERREIRLSLREGIDALENRLLLLNLLVVPIGICGFGVWFWRRRRA